MSSAAAGSSGNSKSRRPDALVYACSGCSSAAQMANQMALWMDREQQAEMSCIAGVGGGVPGLVRTATSGRPIVALDGCAMHCVTACLGRVGVQPTLHITLKDYGVGKLKHREFDRQQAERVYRSEVLPRVHEMRSSEGQRPAPRY